MNYLDTSTVPVEVPTNPMIGFLFIMVFIFGLIVLGKFVSVMISLIFKEDLPETSAKSKKTTTLLYLSLASLVLVGWTYAENAYTKQEEGQKAYWQTIATNQQDFQTNVMAKYDIDGIKPVSETNAGWTLDGQKLLPITVLVDGEEITYLATQDPVTSEPTLVSSSGHVNEGFIPQERSETR